MKKIVVILIAVTMLFTACNSNSASSSKHDFRDVDFGMSTIELFEIEGEPDDKRQSDDLSVYVYENREAFGVENALIQYQIDKNGVGWANVTFQNRYADNKSYVTEYNIVKKNLIAVWGEPESITENEDEFKFSCTFSCTYGHKSLSLSRNPADKAFISVTACSNDYLEATNKRIQEIQKEHQQSDTE